MNTSKLEHLLLSAFCLALAVLCSDTQCMQIPERNDDFEAVVKRGYYDFLDRVGQEKFKELGLKEPVPLVAQGHEAVYQRFLNGVLIYRPNKGSDDGMVRLPIRDLANPLEGTFDLSRCGDAGNYLSISTGYRKGKKPENANKVEIWFMPRFLIENELNTTASHFRDIFPANWVNTAAVGSIWTWGGWGNLIYMDYLTTENVVDLSKINLYKNWEKATLRFQAICARGGSTWNTNMMGWHTQDENFMFIL